MIYQTFIVTGERMTGSKHFTSLRGCLKYAEHLLRGEMAVRITCKKNPATRLPPVAGSKGRRG